MRSVLRALSGIVAVAGGCAVIKLYTCPHIRCMCECACKKKGKITPFLVVCIVLGFIVQNWKKQ